MQILQKRGVGGVWPPYIISYMMLISREIWIFLKFYTNFKGSSELWIWINNFLSNFFKNILSSLAFWLIVNFLSHMKAFAFSKISGPWMPTYWRQKPSCVPLFLVSESSQLINCPHFNSPQPPLTSASNQLGDKDHPRKGKWTSIFL